MEKPTKDPQASERVIITKKESGKTKSFDVVPPSDPRLQPSDKNPLQEDQLLLPVKKKK